MRKITLFLMAIVMMASTAMADNGRQRVIRMPETMAKLVKTDKAQPAKSSVQRQVKKQEMQKMKRQMFAAGKQAAKKAGAKKVMRKAYGDPIILDQPEGELVIYERGGDSYVASMFGIYSQTVVGGAAQAVFDGNTVYLKNLISGFACNGWVKGTVSGSVITIQLPQPILEQEGQVYYAELLQYDAGEQFYVSKDDETVKLSYNPTTRAISTPVTGDLGTGMNIIGMTDSKGEWMGYGDWNFLMNQLEVEPVTAPEGLKTESFVLTAKDYAGHLVNAGIQGDEIYVQGVYTELPEAWVKGTVNGDKVVFKNGQYIGADNYHQYLVSATAEEVYDDYYKENYTEYTLSDSDIEFDFDANTKTLHNNSAILVNAGTSEVFYAAAYEKATVAPFVETAATPAAPTDLTFEPMDYVYYSEYGYGWSYISYTINPTDVDGNFILSDKLSYAIYTRVNGEENVLELTPDAYIYLTEPMKEIPYDFSDGWDISNSSLYLYVTGVDAFGVQTIYRGGGEERRSEISWVETGLEPQPEKETPEYPALDPANTGSSISYSYYDGSQKMITIGDAKAQTYDVAMKLENDGLVGTHIDKISFPLVSPEGVSNIKVWLSTNLRVENGVNVPNLVEIPVTAAASGMVEVELPNPYTIPEDGVYVGYSMTVDEVGDYTSYPIAVVEGENEDGLYLHTSRVYLKWMDMSEQIGASAYIMVEVSGASVMDNAAHPQDNETIYVKTGEPYSVPVVVVNQGAKGISSLDIDFTINGTTTSKHYDLDVPVANAYGLTCIVNAEMPAISQIGNYELTAKVTKVNGVANENAGEDAEGTTPVVVLNTVPRHRALLEEYTGTWCGWCVRGYVALEKLAELYPDDYVLVSYHNGDPMEVLLSDSYAGIDQFPSEVAGFPDAWVDRVDEVDPYYGLGNNPMDVTESLNNRCELFGHADIQLQAELSDDQSQVNVTTHVTFPYNADDVDYGLEYVLVADGLTGEGSDWAQSNYYSGESDLDENLAPFGAAGSSVSGLVFNDVAVMVSETNGVAIEGSIPTTLVADKPVVNNYAFVLDDAVNTSGVPVIQDVTKLKVVAILVDNESGEVINANKCKVVTAADGISELNANAKAVRVEYYDLSGRKVSAPSTGIYLQSKRYQNGRTITRKIVNK